MTGYIAALPMYDWPERRAEVDAEWAAIRDRLRAAGIDAPEELSRNLTEHETWRHSRLLFGQTCWGPMDCGIADYVQVVAQPSYDGMEGGQGELYSSAIVVRRDVVKTHVEPASAVVIPLDILRGARFVYNNPDSMSGLMGLMRDLQALGESLDIFSERIESGSHRSSIRAIAEGRADVAAIDCRSLELARRYEADAVSALKVVGWTAKRKGLPFITARTTPPHIVAALRAALG